MKLAPFLACFIIGIASTLLVLSTINPQRAVVSQRSASPVQVAPKRLPSLAELTQMSDAELGKQDIALVNLTCALGLPGAEQINIPELQKKIDDWAAYIKVQTERYSHKFQKRPEDFEHMEGVFRMYMIGTVLQKDLGVIYNRDRIREVDFTHSQDLFIHGVLGHGKGGTCLSLPVIVTAVARRLGYPVKLSSAKAHFFCRWDDGKHRFNYEASADGVGTVTDEHYMTWPHPIAPEEIEKGLYLTSLNPREELAAFLAARGHCLEDNGYADEAIIAYSSSPASSIGLSNSDVFAIAGPQASANESATGIRTGSTSRQSIPAHVCSTHTTATNTTFDVPAGLSTSAKQ